MFSFIAVCLFVLIAVAVERFNNKDRPEYDSSQTNDIGQWVLLLHIRQDLKLVAFLLGGVILMLGIIADRLA